MAVRPQPAERIVRPRKTAPAVLPVVAVDATGETVLFEDGSQGTFEEFAQFVAGEKRALVSVQGADRLLARLDKLFLHDPAWQFRVVPISKQIWRPNQETTHTEIRQTVVSFFGFRWAKNRRTYHFPIDPLVLTGKTIHEIYPQEGDRTLKLLWWAVEVRDYLASRNLPVRPTGGGVASALLRDPRFYPEPRRKVPKATNDVGRRNLPGNFYELYVPENKRFDALYLDQSRAHHHAAREISFPCANTLYAQGCFHDLDAEREWIDGLSRRAVALQGSYGLLYARVTNPHFKDGEGFVPRHMRPPGNRTLALFTNEIPDFLAQGGTIDKVICAWTSRDAEQGLNKYAAWALDEIAAAPPDFYPWLKPMLLATYGMLAARPRPMESGYRQAKGGEVRYYPAGPDRIEAISRTTRKAIELPMVNAIHRGMIEAETRLRSLRMARELHAAGRHVLAVYADSVFVADDGGDLPLLPHPWGVQAKLTDLEFYNPTSFASRELTKLPGIPRGARFRHARKGSILSVRSGSLVGQVQPTP